MDAQQETRRMFILDERGELSEIERDKAVPVENPIKIKLKNAFEVFVLVDGTENYWISNYGRCANNYRRRDKKQNKDKFYLHKEGDVHYTIYEIERYPRKKRNGKVEIEVNTYKRDTSPGLLVAETFLKEYRGRYKLWHKDGNTSNNWYKNLLWVNERDFKALKDGKITWQELNLEQEYIEYQNKASYEAMKIYNTIRARCKPGEKIHIGKCYKEVTMCQEWLDDPKTFVRWYLDHYYEVDGESMAVDKDLFGKGAKVYSPETCCILPQRLNTYLTNCKKHYFDGQTPENTLPLGIYHNKKSNRYYAKIQFSGFEKPIQFAEHDTIEEAFKEYRYLKKLDAYRVIESYRDKIPEYIYEELLKIEIEPY